MNFQEIIYRYSKLPEDKAHCLFMLFSSAFTKMSKNFWIDCNETQYTHFHVFPSLYSHIMLLIQYSELPSF